MKSVRLPSRLRPIVVAAVAGALAVSCSSGPGDEPRPDIAMDPDVGAAGTWEGPPAPDESGRVAVEEFNGYLEETMPNWATSPIRVAVEFLALRDPAAFETSVVLTSSPEAGDEATVTVTQDGLLDDSVRASRYALMLVRQNDGRWELITASWSQRCQPGRGHQDFTPKRCI